MTSLVSAANDAAIAQELANKAEDLSLKDKNVTADQEEDGDDDDDDEGEEGGAGATGDKKKKKKRKPKKKKKAASGTAGISELKDVVFDESLECSRLLGGRRDYFRKYGQTFPPTIPVDELFSQGKFPEGEIQPHGKTKYPDPHSSWARMSEEEKRYIHHDPQICILSLIVFNQIELMTV